MIHIGTAELIIIAFIVLLLIGGTKKRLIYRNLSVAWRTFTGRLRGTNKKTL